MSPTDYRLALTLGPSASRPASVVGSDGSHLNSSTLQRGEHRRLRDTNIARDVARAPSLLVELNDPCAITGRDAAAARLLPIVDATGRRPERNRGVGRV